MDANSVQVEPTAPSGSAHDHTKQQPLQPQQQQQQQQPPPVAQNAPPRKRSAVMTRDSYNQQSLGASLHSSVKQARVLMVGAGGIGCELLKNLVLAGFGEIHVVDLDTIDLSNLNRQFLFRHEHIKKSKALVAKDAAQRFNPNAKIVSHHANIKDTEFNVPWFREFNIVFNALDNLEARRHVNKMCLAADVPLIESGTTGFNGQVQVIKKGVTACYDCTPKETPKSFPVCTIRSTPSQPIHCIVWAKSYLLNEIFGASEDQAAFDHSEDADNAHEIQELRREAAALKNIRETIGGAEFPVLLFDKVFRSDIERLRSVEDMWKSRRPPEPLQYENLLARSVDALSSKDMLLTKDQTIWSLEESLVVFKDSLDRLSKRWLQLQKTKDPAGPEPIITFDKDDIDTLDFVAASANIRSTVFGIERKSRFDIKQMAGNIIPAIATTNAIVAGLCVLQSFKVLKGEYTQAKEVFLTPFAPARLLAPDKAREPNPNCPVCGVYNVSVTVDLSRATLSDVVDFIKDKLGYGDKDIVVNNDVGILYDADETDNLPKKLSELGITLHLPTGCWTSADGDTGITKDGFLTVIDEDDDDTTVNVIIDIQEGVLGDEEKPVKGSLTSPPDIPRKPKHPASEKADSVGLPNGKHALEADQSTETKGTKRARSVDEEPPSKKTKVVKPSPTDVVDVEDGGGAIVIDDD
ncbi:hypothetical protein S40293_07149 [Stachybotrys chartarum IBT 40293]|nr:hypothetical protein S40293_07149 [Stachybotrys chartarum IBT 40293]